MRNYRILFLFLFCGIVGITIGTVVYARVSSGSIISPLANQDSSDRTIYSASVEDSPKAGMPVTLIISKINVGVQVELVGLDEKKNMDIPRDVNNVAWFKYGPSPGEKGNAVMAGHLDKKDGSPAVFWDLGKLEVGDAITVKDAKGQSWTFKVTRKESYPYDQFPIQEVFGPYNSPRLNLITCGGDWNKVDRVYSHRLVIFSELQNM